MCERVDAVLELRVLVSELVLGMFGTQAANYKYVFGESFLLAGLVGLASLGDRAIVRAEAAETASVQ